MNHLVGWTFRRAGKPNRNHKNGGQPSQQLSQGFLRDDVIAAPKLSAESNQQFRQVPCGCNQHIPSAPPGASHVLIGAGLPFTALGKPSDTGPGTPRSFKGLIQTIRQRHVREIVIDDARERIGQTVLNTPSFAGCGGPCRIGRHLPNCGTQGCII